MIARTFLPFAAALLAAPAVAAPSDIPALLDRSGFKGFAMVADADRILWQTPRASCPPSAPSDDIIPRGDIMLCHPRDPAVQRWPWASVSKQMLAVLVMKQVDARRLDLDVPASHYLPALGPDKGAPTIRQLLQHRGGLRNPEDTTKASDGMPGWYRQTGDGVRWCLTGRTAPGGDWRYNNCDSLVLGAILQRVTGRSVAQLFDTQIVRPLRLQATAFAGTATDRSARRADYATALSADELAILSRFAAAGGLVGTPLDLLAIDRALLDGRLLSPTARAEMWKGDPKLGFMALAQWSFAAPLKGCASTVRIVERRGGIGRFQVRNLILPDANRIVILFSADPKFEFGEIWQGKGLSHDLLAAAACS